MLRLHPSSIHTERSSGEWIVRFVRVHGLRSREDLVPAAPKIEAFLTDVAVHGHVAPATQNQAMKALVFLYQRVLTQALPGSITAVRADQKLTVPVVLTRAAVAAVLSLSWTAPPQWSPHSFTEAACASWKRSGSGSRTSTIR